MASSLPQTILPHHKGSHLTLPSLLSHTPKTTGASSLHLLKILEFYLEGFLYF